MKLTKITTGLIASIALGMSAVALGNTTTEPLSDTQKNMQHMQGNMNDQMHKSGLHNQHMNKNTHETMKSKSGNMHETTTTQGKMMHTTGTKKQ